MHQVVMRFHRRWGPFNKDEVGGVKPENAAHLEMTGTATPLHSLLAPVPRQVTEAGVVKPGWNPQGRDKDDKAKPPMPREDTPEEVEAFQALVVPMDKGLLSPVMDKMLRRGRAMVKSEGEA
jgi:hypothetical protein